MSNLKRLVVTFCLIIVIAVTAFAGEVQAPPCPPPDPGEIQTPPCSTVQQTTDDPTNPDETEYQVIVIDNIVSAAVGTLLSIW